MPSGKSRVLGTLRDSHRLFTAQSSSYVARLTALRNTTLVHASERVRRANVGLEGFAVE